MNAESERNVRSVEALYEAERRRDIVAWERLWSESGRQSFFFAAPTEPVVGRAALVEAARAKFADRPPYDIHVTAEPLADPSKVLARLTLTAPGVFDGAVPLWCLVSFDGDGLIAEIEEIGDTNVGSPV